MFFGIVVCVGFVGRVVDVFGLVCGGCGGGMCGDFG